MCTKVVIKYANNQLITNKAPDNGNVCDIIGCMDDMGMWAVIVACACLDKEHSIRLQKHRISTLVPDFHFGY